MFPTVHKSLIGQDQGDVSIHFLLKVGSFESLLEREPLVRVDDKEENQAFGKDGLSKEEFPTR